VATLKFIMITDLAVVVNTT